MMAFRRSKYVVLAVLAALPLLQCMKINHPEPNHNARSISVDIEDVSCSSDEDCSLLGVCSQQGQCVCDPGWQGSSCDQLKVQPYTPGDGIVSNDKANWGGNPVLVNGTWHLFATQMALHCELRQFKPNSEVVRAVSNTLVGPYTVEEVALPPWHHNPTIAGPTPDGFYLLFSISNLIPNPVLQNCTKDTTPYPSKNIKHNLNSRKGDIEEDVIQNTTKAAKASPPPPVIQGQGVAMAVSKSPLGPWENERLVLGSLNTTQGWDCTASNPAPVILSNGTIILAYRTSYCNGTRGENLGIAVASHWSAEFVRRDEPVITTAEGYGFNEDPFMFVDQRGAWHIIAHNQGPNGLCVSGPSCASHLYSKDSYRWNISPTPVYNGTVTFINGTIGNMITRQRPQLVFDPNSSAPIALFNAGSFFGNDFTPGIFTHTFVFAIAP